MMRWFALLVRMVGKTTAGPTMVGFKIWKKRTSIRLSAGIEVDPLPSRVMFRLLCETEVLTVHEVVAASIEPLRSMATHIEGSV